jgi:diguanylate cyclase (GGDEF)-like protein
MERRQQDEPRRWRSARRPTVKIDRRSAAHPDIPLLRVVAGRDVFHFVVLRNGDNVVIGRDDDCQLALSDVSVSRRHACIGEEDGRFRLKDLGSSNGTFLDCAPIDDCTLAPGSLIEVGSVPLRFDLVTLEELAHLKTVRERLEASDRDPLTGLLTRACLNTLPDRLQRASSAGRAVSLVFVDVDGFKLINDGFGHVVGDDVLRAVARLLALGVREAEACVRYGGDELLVVVEDATEAPAASLAERFRTAVADHAWAKIARGLTVTVSCGVAQHVAGESVRGWIERADCALYSAKHAGRNRVVCASAVASTREAPAAEGSGARRRSARVDWVPEDETPKDLETWTRVIEAVVSGGTARLVWNGDGWTVVSAFRFRGAATGNDVRDELRQALQEAGLPIS